MGSCSIMAFFNQEKRSSMAPVAGLTGAIAMGMVIGYSMSKPSRFTSSNQRNRSEAYANNTSNNHPSKESITIRNRIYKTYAYFAGSIGITGLSAFVCFNYTKHSKQALIRMNKHPKWYLLTSLIASIALLIGTKMTSIRRRPILKHLLWCAMHIHEGAVLSILGFIGGPIIIKAAMYTAAILGSISLIAASGSDEKVLRMGAWLGVGLGFLMGLSAIEWVYPSIGKSNLFQNVNIYGGLLLFGLQTAYDTKKVLMRAKKLDQEYDAINEQMDLYLNSINFFLDMIRLIIKQQNEEQAKKKRQRDRDDENQ